MKTRNKIGILGLGLLGKKLTKKAIGSSYLKDKVVLITGGSKGLGLVLAEHLIPENCKIAICARSLEELQEAQKHLEEKGGDISVYQCDVADENQVKNLIDNVIQLYGRIDIVINNAGIIMVGPMETFTHKDYEKAMDVMYWGIANTTLNVLPHMKSRKQGHIVNITSVGGKVSVPHLLPYNASKFAAVGFSEGSAADLRKNNIYVTTIVPGLMRTGSYVNALFQKGNKSEFKMFSFMSSAPFITLSADKAARRILQAVKEKRPFKVIGIQAKALIEFHHFFPNFTAKAFGFVSKHIPVMDQAELESGKEITKREKNAEVIGVRRLGKKAQEDHQPRY